MRYPLPSDAPDGLGLLSILVHLGGPALCVAAPGRGGPPNDSDATAGVCGPDRRIRRSTLASFLRFEIKTSSRSGITIESGIVTAPGNNNR